MVEARPCEAGPRFVAGGNTGRRQRCHGGVGLETPAPSSGPGGAVFDLPLHHLPLYATLLGAAGSLVVWAWARRVQHRQDATERRGAIAERADRVGRRAAPSRVRPAETPEASGEASTTAARRRVR